MSTSLVPSSLLNPMVCPPFSLHWEEVLGLRRMVVGICGWLEFMAGTVAGMKEEGKVKGEGGA